MNFVLTVFNRIIALCLGLTKRDALFVTHAAEIAPVLAPGISATAPLTAEAQWQRVSTLVERSIKRAQNIGEQQSAARQQLDAAEYTLHRLIEELNEVMTSPVQLPKRVELAVTKADAAFVPAMAA